MFRNCFTLNTWAFVILTEQLNLDLLITSKRSNTTGKPTHSSGSALPTLPISSLKVLNLTINSAAIRINQDNPNPNRLYQDNEDADLGNKLIGFDKLVSSEVWNV